jgi:localization factor PodJL
LRAPLAAEPAAQSDNQHNGVPAKDGDRSAGTESASVPELHVDPGIPGIAVRIDQAEETGKSSAGDGIAPESSPPPVPWTPQERKAQPKPASHKPEKAEPQSGSSSRNEKMPPAALGPQSLRLAAARGNAQAQYEVGARYAKGSSVERDDKKAMQWFARAAAQGLAPAQYRLAALYERGQGAEKDAALARVWYERAAKQGNVKAMHNLAVMMTAGDDREPDYETAAKWFTKAARHGLRDSQFNLGILYEAGLGVQKNPANAYQWFSLAARRGDKEAEKRKQHVGQQLRREQIRNAERSIRQWRPKPTDKAANEVRPPEGGWHKAAAGSAGKDALVTKAQKLLNELGYDAGVPDGLFGPQTRAAVRRFGERNGLDLTGKVTPDLVSRLEARAS